MKFTPDRYKTQLLEWAKRYLQENGFQYLDFGCWQLTEHGPCIALDADEYHLSIAISGAYISSETAPIITTNQEFAQRLLNSYIHLINEVAIAGKEFNK